LALEKTEKKEYHPLSSAQKRLYVLHQVELESTAYNIPQVVVMTGELDRERLQDTFRKMIRRHESLRTSFKMVAEKPVQAIHDHVEFDMGYDDIPEVEEEEGTRGLAPLPIPATRGSQPAIALISSFIRPFDLSQAPLLRVGLLKTGENQHLLMTDMHHIITDGTSMDLFVKEFMALYVGVELPALKL
ncbi:MAG: hypothetical protein GY940_15555, partial [bacterium]|nr:hypothetical protein [bacterium]